MLNQPIAAILVLQGAEYQAVCRGLRHAQVSLPVFPVAIGWPALRRSLAQLQQNGLKDPQPILLMGLCGSLSSQYQVGDLVLYQGCLLADGDQAPPLALHDCDLPLTDQLDQRLRAQRLAVARVSGLTCDRVICTAAEKQQLGQTWQAGVVDMEGAIVLASLQSEGMAVAMLRVVSDDCLHAIPNLNAALMADGTLNSGALIRQFVKEPIAAARLIQGAIRGLNVLQSVTTRLFTELPVDRVAID